MPKVEKSVDEALDVTRYSFSGTVTLEDILENLKEFYRQPTKHLLWDVRDADLNTATTDDLKKIVSMSKGFADSRPGGKTAILGSSELQFGLARMFATFSEFEHHPIQASAFRKLDDAMHWIASND